MYPSTITVWGRNSVFKTFHCNRCKHEKDTDSILRFVFGNSLIEYAENERLNIVFNDEGKKADSSQTGS
jgi:hypothetical protein